MATVYLAEHPRISKKVAVKVISHELASSPEMVSRFLAEARAASQINHEHVVDILDFGQTDTGENFMIMEYLEGQTLSVRVRGAGRLDMAVARSIGQQIADALVPAHQQGVVHRDLKPDNIFLIRRPTNPDFVKILDFGLAKLLSGSEGLQHRTSSGSVLGTPHYMAPEQCEGRLSVDGRADLYSLGCILFHMVTGSLPFPGDGFAEVILKHLAEPPPSVRTINRQISPAFDKLILHCLAKNRDHRFQSAEELMAALSDPEKWSLEFGDDPSRVLGPPVGTRRPPQAPPVEPPELATVMGQQVPAGLGGASGANTNALPGAPAAPSVAHALSPIAAGSIAVTPRPTPIGRAGASGSPPAASGPPPPLRAAPGGGAPGGSYPMPFSASSQLLPPPPMSVPASPADASQLAEMPVVARAAPQMATMIGEMPAPNMAALAALAPSAVNSGSPSGPSNPFVGGVLVPSGQQAAGASIPTAFPQGAPQPSGYAAPGPPPLSQTLPAVTPGYAAPGHQAGSSQPAAVANAGYSSGQSYPSANQPYGSQPPPYGSQPPPYGSQPPPYGSQPGMSSQSNLAPSAATPASASNSAGRVSPVAPLIGKLVAQKWAQAFLALPPARRLLILRASAATFGSLVLVLVLLLVWPRNVPLVVRSEPDEAEVLRDGASLGMTPVLLELKRGTPVKLTLRKAGFDDTEQEFTVGGEKVVVVTLEAQGALGASPKPSGNKQPKRAPDDGADDGGDSSGDSAKGDGSDDSKKKNSVIKKKKKKKVVVF